MATKTKRAPRRSWAVCAIALAAAFALAPAVDAATLPTKSLYVFEAVDDVATSPGVIRELVISGLEQGASVPVEELRFRFEHERIAERCERYGLLMMERPGRYLLEVRETFEWSCRLRVRTE